MEGNYLIPANSKKSMLIFGLFTSFDLILFGTGLGISLLFVMFVQLNNTWLAIAAISPGLLTGLLVMPVPYHHNVLTVIKSIYEFYTTRQKFIWRGWCYSNEQSDEKQVYRR